VLQVKCKVVLRVDTVLEIRRPRHSHNTWMRIWADAGVNQAAMRDTHAGIRRLAGYCTKQESEDRTISRHT
jgi:hypothetical protein